MDKPKVRIVFISGDVKIQHQEQQRVWRIKYISDISSRQDAVMMLPPCSGCCQKKPTDLEVVHVYEVPDPPLLSRALQAGPPGGALFRPLTNSFQTFIEGGGGHRTGDERGKQARVISVSTQIPATSCRSFFLPSGPCHIFFLSFFSASLSLYLYYFICISWIYCTSPWCIFITWEYAHGRA